MSKPRVIEFIETSGKLGAGSFSFAAIFYCISFYEHLIDHNLRASWLAVSGGACLLIGAYSAWSNERKLFEELQAKAARPQLAFTATKEPQDRWLQLAEMDPPQLFTLTHLAGDPAQFIKIATIQSLHSKNLVLEFDQIDFMGTVQKFYWPHFRLLQLGQEINRANKVRNVAIVFFQTDAAKYPELKRIDYPITIKFRWNDQWQHDTVMLSWNTATQTLSTSPHDTVTAQS